jgi:hypothetical protein
MNRIALVLLLAATSLLSSEAIMASVEKWVDPHGRVHYGDHPPAGVDTTAVEIRPNVIETGPNVVPTVIDKPTPELASRVEQARTRVRRDLQSYVENCRNNRGVDCELEAMQMIDGPAPVIFPGDPAVFPRPDLKLPPPGLPLKFAITP